MNDDELLCIASIHFRNAQTTVTFKLNIKFMFQDCNSILETTLLNPHTRTSHLPAHRLFMLFIGVLSVTLYYVLDIHIIMPRWKVRSCLR